MTLYVGWLDFKVRSDSLIGCLLLATVKRLWVFW